MTSPNLGSLNALAIELRGRGLVHASNQIIAAIGGVIVDQSPAAPGAAPASPAPVAPVEAAPDLRRLTIDALKAQIQAYDNNGQFAISAPLKSELSRLVSTNR